MEGALSSRRNHTERLAIRITPKLKAKLQAAAEADGRSVSNYVEMLIGVELKKKENT